MRRLPWIVFVVAAGLVLPATAQGGKGKNKGEKGEKKENKAPMEGGPIKVDNSETPLGASTWKPGFDYTDLPPATETLWAQLSPAAVEMEGALSVAAEVLGGPVWAKKAGLIDREGHPAWSLQLFTAGADGGEPRRVDLLVSGVEPKILERVDLPELSEQDRGIWNNLAKATVQAEAMISICKTNARGDRVEAMVTEPHMRKLEFVSLEKSYWACELMGIEGEIPRRYQIEVWASKPALRMKLLMDRFPGTPLRRNHPVELPGGMFLYDFTTGDGPSVTRESKVRVHYRLFLLDNTKLHDTWRTNLPETFLVTEAPLKGMTDGMVGMRAGGKRKIAMPHPLAFGEAGNEIVPPKSMVVCDVFVEEILSP